MAFNFNWSPLLADTSRARDMLTTALNKSPKPPIIVDDIIVTELNLGSTPPELEILEIGDLADDRFRGIFKMSYTGDAFLTLKTKVQVNPLKTHLSTKPDFASPTPGGSIRPNNTAVHHTIEFPIVRIRHSGVLETKGLDVGIQERPPGVTEGLLDFRFDTVRPRLSTKGHRGAITSIVHGGPACDYPPIIITVVLARVPGDGRRKTGRYEGWCYYC
jgi:hypothetical protein